MSIRPSSDSIAERAAEGARRILDRTDGDVLGLPARRRRDPPNGPPAGTAGRRASDLAVMPLYGDLPAEKQDLVLAPSARRKVVLATNVAETSITIEGITGVVDTGWPDRWSSIRTSAWTGCNWSASRRPAADQRAGRAGRTRPGRLPAALARADACHRPAHDEPEIRRLDLAGPVLQLRAWGETDLAAFPWFEPPPRRRAANRPKRCCGDWTPSTPRARSRNWARRWPGCRSARDWDECSWKASGWASPRRSPWRPRCFRNAIPSFRRRKTLPGDAPSRPRRTRTCSTAWRRWRSSSSRAGSKRRWVASNARRRGSCCTPGTNCSARSIVSLGIPGMSTNG